MMASEGSPLTPVERKHVERALEYYNDALNFLEEAEAYLGWWVDHEPWLKELGRISNIVGDVIPILESALEHTVGETVSVEVISRAVVSNSRWRTYTQRYMRADELIQGNEDDEDPEAAKP